jgi:3-oxoacyl-[acyl-carrier-protein] synthase II
MNGQKAVVVGYDAVSPLGVDFDRQWERAKKGESGIGALTRFTLPKDFPVCYAGQVDESDERQYSFLSPKNLAHWISPLFKYGMLAVYRALERSGIAITPELAPRVGVTFSSAVGGLDVLFEADRKLVANNKLPHPFTNPNACINMIGAKVSILTKASGPIVSTINACATGSSSIIVGAMLLELGRADVVICGAVDFCLVEALLAGFATMNGAYRIEDEQPLDPPHKASRPFSKDRRGFIVSEGAGAVILTTRDFARAHGLRYSVEIAGWSMTSDAYHFVAPYLPAVQRCIAGAIDDAGIKPVDIDAVNAHAASTKVGDKVEYDALRAVFGARIPPVTANKSLIGHAMGASSAIEAIYSIAAMREGLLPPTANYQRDPEIDIDCVPDGLRYLDQTHVLKNSFGFGGCNACVVFRRAYE